MNIYKTLFIILTICLYSCSDPNKESNELYSKAIAILGGIEEKQTYAAILKSYNEVDEIFTKIVDKYPSTNLAVGLLSGQTLISGLSLKEFRNKLEWFTPQLGSLAKAETDFYLSWIMLKIENESYDSRQKNWDNMVITEMVNRGLVSKYIGELNEIEKSTTLTDIIIEFAKRGLLIESEKLLSVYRSKVKNYDQYGDYLAKIQIAMSNAYLKKGELDKVKSLLKLTEKDLLRFLEHSKDDKYYSDEYSIVRYYRLLAEIYKKIDDPISTERLMNSAIELASLIKNNRFKLFSYREIAIGYLKLEETSKAKKYIGLYGGQSIRYDIEKIGILSKENKIDEAIAKMQSLPKDSYWAQEYAASRITSYLVDNGRYLDANKVVMLVDSKSQRDKSILNLAKQYIDIEAYQKASDILEKMKGSGFEEVEKIIFSIKKTSAREQFIKILKQSKLSEAFKNDWYKFNFYIKTGLHKQAEILLDKNSNYDSNTIKYFKFMLKVYQGGNKDLIQDFDGASEDDWFLLFDLYKWGKIGMEDGNLTKFHKKNYPFESFYL